MKKCGVIFVLLLGVLSEPDVLGNPTDSSSNTELEVRSAVIVPSIMPGETAVEVVFDKDVTLPDDCDIHGFGALKLPISTMFWTNPLLEDLNEDGHLDLVVSKGTEIYVYINGTNVQGDLLFEGDGQLIATRQVINQNTGAVESVAGWPEEYSQTSITFSDIDLDGDRDLICGEAWEGNLVWFPREDPDPSEEWNFGGQKGLRFESGGGVRQAIALASESQVSGYGLDVSMPSVSTIDYHGDGLVDDLLVSDRNYPLSNPVFRIFPHIGIDPQNGGPLYGEPELLLFDGNPLTFTAEYTHRYYTVIDLKEFDDLPGLDIVATTGGGGVYVSSGYFPGGGTSPSFEDFVLASDDLGAAKRNISQKTGATTVDADGDGDLDMLVSSITTSGPSRRLLKLHRSDGPAFSNLDVDGVIVGSSKSNPQGYYSEGSLSQFSLADLDGNGKMDIVEGLSNGQVAVTFSVDTSNTFDPFYAGSFLCRNDDGDVFDFEDYDGNYLGRAQGLTTLDDDSDGVPDALLFARLSSIEYVEILEIDTEGCMVLADPVVLTLPAGLNIGSRLISICVGDFLSSVAGVDRLILVKHGSTTTDSSGTVYNPEEYYSLDLTVGSPPTLGNAVLFHSNQPISIPHRRSPGVWDVDSDGKLDLVFGQDGSYEWWENQSTTGAPTGIGDFVVRAKAVDENQTMLESSTSSSLRFFDSGDSAELFPLAVSDAKVPGEGKVGLNVRRFVGLSSQNELILEKHATKSDILISQIQASKVEWSATSADRVKVSVPIELVVGDSIAINSIFTGGTEVSFGSVPIGNLDSDGDGLSDEWELANGLDPENRFSREPTVEDGQLDIDGDEVLNLDEFRFGFSGLVSDSDGDGYSDHLAMDLEVFLEFDEVDGQTAPDSSGKRRDGTLVSAPVWLPGSPLDPQVGGIDSGAIEFPATEDAVTLPTEVIEGSGNLTVSLWFKTNSVSPDQSLIGASNSSAAKVFELRLTEDLDGSSVITIISDKSTEPKEWQVGRDLADGLWHHLVVTRESTQESSAYYHAYVDGNLLSDIPRSVGGASISNIDSLVLAQGFLSPLGYDPSLAFEGVLDELRIYSRVLLIEEITQLFRANDIDRDSFPDDYEIAIGGTLEELSLPDEDPDRDGVYNWGEYLAGTDPFDPLNGVSAQLQVVSGDFQHVIEGQWAELPIVFNLTETQTPTGLSGIPITLRLSNPISGSLANLISGSQHESGDVLELYTDEAGEVSILFKSQ